MGSWGQREEPVEYFLTKYILSQAPKYVPEQLESFIGKIGNFSELAQ